MTEQALVHVVDDDPGVRDSLAFLLQSAGHAVRAYDSAAAFLAVAPGLQAGCVLTDVRMPGMDGLALQQRIAALGGSLAVVVMTGHGDVPIAVAALKAGARDFLEKPFDDDRLLAVVREALDVSQRAQDAQAATAGIAVRLASLTPREREVLDAAGRRPSEQDDRLRPGHQPAHRGGAAGPGDGKDGRAQPGRTGAHGVGGPKRRGAHAGARRGARRGEPRGARRGARRGAHRRESH